MQIKMKIISSTEYNILLGSLIPKLYIATTADLPDMDRIIKKSEIYVQATLGTNYQECNINDYIKTLQRAIELKCQNL